MSRRSTGGSTTSALLTRAARALDAAALTRGAADAAGHAPTSPRVPPGAYVRGDPGDDWLQLWDALTGDAAWSVDVQERARVTVIRLNDEPPEGLVLDCWATPARHAGRLWRPGHGAAAAAADPAAPAAAWLGDPPATRDQAERAIAVVDDLRAWLSLTYAEVAALTGVSKSAMLYWSREGAAPRASVFRRLWRVYALVRALRLAVGQDALWSTLTGVTDAAGRSGYELLRQDRYDAAEDLLRPLIFRRDEQPERPRVKVPFRDDEPAPANLPPRDLRPLRQTAQRIRLRP